MPYTKLVVGLTGGIGSGKSTVAKYFADLGASIIDTDEISRGLTAISQPAYAAIVKKFGTGILLADGTLNRKALRDIIFNDAEQRIWLENLLHPLIREECKRLAQESQAPYCIVVIPLLFETTPYDYLKRILVVDAPEELQINRTAERDKITETQVQTIMQSQVSRQQRLDGADDIIFNDKDPEHLLLQVKKLHDLYSVISLKG